MPPPHGVQPGLPCLTDAPHSREDGPTQIHANALRLHLYPSRDSQEEADRVAASVSGEVAYHIPSENAYALHIPCPGSTPTEIEEGLELLMATLLGVAQREQRGPAPGATRTRARADATTHGGGANRAQVPTPAPREGDHILHIQADPTVSRLAPSQAEQVHTLTAFLTNGGTMTIDPGDPDLTYRLKRLRVDDAAGNPEATRDVLINSRANTAPTRTLEPPHTT